MLKINVPTDDIYQLPNIDYPPEYPIGRILRLRNDIIVYESFEHIVKIGYTSESNYTIDTEATYHYMLNHKNIIPFVDYGKTPNNNSYIVTQCARGDLFSLFRLEQNTHNYSVKLMLDVMIQIANGLRYIHDCQMVHADLDPENIFYSVQSVEKRKLNVYIGDFGLTFKKGEIRGVMGKPFWCSHDIQTTQKSDIYSLGKTIYFIVIKQSPELKLNNTDKYVKNGLLKLGDLMLNKNPIMRPNIYVVLLKLKSLDIYKHDIDV